MTGAVWLRRPERPWRHSSFWVRSQPTSPSCSPVDYIKFSATPTPTLIPAAASLRCNEMTSSLRHSAIVGIATIALLGAHASAQTGVIRRVEVPAPSLRANLVGDPAARPASIYLPERYFTHPRQRFAVIYLLHGF